MDCWGCFPGTRKNCGTFRLVERCLLVLVLLVDLLAGNQLCDISRRGVSLGRAVSILSSRVCVPKQRSRQRPEWPLPADRYRTRTTERTGKARGGRGKAEAKRGRTVRSRVWKSNRPSVPVVKKRSRIPCLFQMTGKSRPPYQNRGQRERWRRYLSSHSFLCRWAVQP